MSDPYGNKESQPDLHQLGLSDWTIEELLISMENTGTEIEPLQPLGLTDRSIHAEMVRYNRLKDITDAMKRYSVAFNANMGRK